MRSDGHAPESARPRVLLLVTLAGVGGAQACLAALVPALAERYDVVVAAHGDGPLPATVRAAGARYVALRHMRREVGARDVLALLELIVLMRRERPAIVHANSSKAGILGRIAAAATGVPVRLFTAHGWAFAAHAGLRGRCYRWADRLARPLTTTVICVSESERRAGLAAGTCEPRRTHVIHNGVDVSRWPRARADGAPPVVVAVGRLAAPKDPLTLVAALARLEPGSFRALFVGDGPDRTVVAGAVDAAGLGGAVRLLGARDDLPGLLAGADVFVLSSRSEGFPLSVLEAMAAGLPVVASAVGGIPEAVIDGETGLLVSPGDASALAVALRALLADGLRRRALGMAGCGRAAARFDVARFRAEHVALYESALAAAPKRRPR